MTYFVSQCQLGNFRRNSAVVIHESDDTGVERSLRGLIHPSYGLGIRFILLANTTGSTGRRSDPSETECTAGKIPIDNCKKKKKKKQ